MMHSDGGHQVDYRTQEQRFLENLSSSVLDDSQDEGFDLQEADDDDEYIRQQVRSQSLK